MTLKQIKSAVETFYKCKDIGAKGRKKNHVEAKRMACWYAREIGHRPCNIEKAFGIRHDIQNYHWNTQNDLIFFGNISTVNNCWELFGVDVTKGQSKAKLERIRKRTDDILMSCPESCLEELYERLELMVKSYNHTNKTKKTTVYVANAISIED